MFGSHGYNSYPAYLRQDVYLPYSAVVEVSPRPSDLAEVAPVTRERVKQQARVDTDAEDDLIDLYLAAAVAGVEETTGHWMGQRSVQAYLPAFPAWMSVYLPGGHVQEVSEVAYRDENGDYETLDTEHWEAQAFTLRSSVRMKSGTSILPRSHYNEDRRAVRISYVAGYASVEAIPVPLRQATLMVAAELYIEREAHRTQPGVIAIPNPAAQMLMGAYKIRWPS